MGRGEQPLGRRRAGNLLAVALPGWLPALRNCYIGPNCSNR